MSNTKYAYVNDGGKQTLTVWLDGEAHVIDSQHPNFYRAVKAARDGDNETLASVLDILGSVAEALEGSGLYLVDSTVYNNGLPLPEALSSKIISVLRQKGNVTALVRFAKRLDENTSANSRNQLYTFIEKYGLTIDDDGNFIAYKGVRATGEVGLYRSLNSGYGVVDGVEYADAQLPQRVGSVVSVPRNRVDDSVDIGCSFGLHAGTWEYASTFGNGATLTVRIDPANVVSVPRDCEYQKIRCSEYIVIATTESKWTRSVVWDGTPDYSDYIDDDEDAWEDGDFDKCPAGCDSDPEAVYCKYCGCEI